MTRIGVSLLLSNSIKNEIFVTLEFQNISSKSKNMSIKKQLKELVEKAV